MALHVQNYETCGSGSCTPAAAILARALGTCALLAAMLVLAACGAPSESEEQSSSAAVAVVHPYYHADGFQKHGQRYTYSTSSAVADKTGIDVSESQGWIDWQAVRADGIRFAFIRAGYRGSTEGGLYRDEFFEHNLAAAKEAGIECGVYLFSQAVTVEEAKEEAAFVLGLLGQTPLEYPVVFDYEMRASGINSRVSGVDREKATLIAQAFCNAVEAAGYDAMLYGNGYDLGHYDLAVLSKWPRWYAEYGALPSFTEEYAIWQYANDGSVAGINTVVDLNLDLSDALAAKKAGAGSNPGGANPGADDSSSSADL